MKPKDKEKKPKKFVDRAKKVPYNLDFDALQPAIVDGSIVKDQTLVLRRLRKDDALTLCSVLSVSDAGDVTLWDETLGQRFMFNVTDLSVHNNLKVYDKTKLSKAIKKPKEVAVVTEEN